MTRTLSNPGGHEALTFTDRRGRPRRRHARRRRRRPAPRSCRPRRTPSARTTFGLPGRPGPQGTAGDHGRRRRPRQLDRRDDAPVGRRLHGRRLAERPGRHPDGALHRRPAIASASSPTRRTGSGAATWPIDAAAGCIWQVNVGGDNGIYGIDPSDGSVVQVDHRRAVEQHQPARPRLRPARRRVLHRRLERGHRLPRGRPVARRRRARRSASATRPTRTSPVSPGTAPSACSGRPTNSDTDTICLIDPIDLRDGRARSPHPDGGGFDGAGIELDAVGNIWTVGQNSGNAYLVEMRPADLQRRAVADRRARPRARSRPTARTDLDDLGRLDRARARRLPGDRRRSRPNDPGQRPHPGAR